MEDILRGYVNRLETQATPGLSPRHVAFLTTDEEGNEPEVQVETHEHRLQTTLELAYSNRRAVEVKFIVIDKAKFLILVNVLRRGEVP